MSKSFSLNELAYVAGAEIEGDGAFIVSGVADLSSAASSDISFLAASEYLPVSFEQAMARSHAGAIVVAPAAPRATVTGRNYLLHADPSRAFQKIVEIFYPEHERSSAFVGIHPTAVVHATAKIGIGVCLAPYVVIDGGAQVGDGTKVGAATYIGPGSIIGRDCLIHPHVIIRECCRLGDRVIIQPGAVIGSCGFGYTTDASGCHNKLSQLGVVEIGDDVEIGANATIDRARFGTTSVAHGTKIDNGVQLAHGVAIGAHNLMAAHCAIAGSVKTGSHVVMGGQVGVSGHLNIAAGTMIAAQSGISKSITKPGKYAGKHATPLAEHNRNSVMLRNIEKTIRQIIRQEFSHG